MNNKVIDCKRIEDKYIISYDKALLLKNAFNKVLSKDVHSQEKAYVVRSLYFDSINNRDYLTKLAGTEERQKIRIRTYDIKSNKCKLEIKKKQGALQEKISLWITKNDAKDLINGKYGTLIKYFNTSKEAIELYTMMQLYCYRPTVLVEYDRLAYTYPVNDTRITFDMNVRSSESNLKLFEECPLVPITDKVVILEVKYNGDLTDYVSRMIKAFEIDQVAISKYCESRKIFMDFYF